MSSTAFYMHLVQLKEGVINDLKQVITLERETGPKYHAPGEDSKIPPKMQLLNT